MQQGDRCCWICNPCKDQEFVVNEFSCEKCPDGWWPHQGNKSGCYQLPEQYMRWNSVYALVPVGISVLGILLTIFVITTFVKYKETPIVKASGRELSFILLGGILFSFLMTFVLLAKPSLFICCIQRFGVSVYTFDYILCLSPLSIFFHLFPNLFFRTCSENVLDISLTTQTDILLTILRQLSQVGFGFSIIYGALLTKTNRISRIFDSARKSARRPSFISPKSQVIISMIFVLIQVSTTSPSLSSHSFSLSFFPSFSRSLSLDFIPSIHFQ